MQQYVESKNSAKLTVHDPRNGSLVADDIALAGQADIDLAVSGARSAFETWRKVAPGVRRDCMLRLADLIEANREVLAELTRLTLGAPSASAGAFDVGLAIDSFRYFAGWQVFSPVSKPRLLIRCKD